jgi:hypothetical protein
MPILTASPNLPPPISARPEALDGRECAWFGPAAASAGKRSLPPAHDHTPLPPTHLKPPAARRRGRHLPEDFPAVRVDVAYRSASKPSPAAMARLINAELDRNEIWD